MDELDKLAAELAAGDETARADDGTEAKVDESDASTQPRDANGKFKAADAETSESDQSDPAGNADVPEDESTESDSETEPPKRRNVGQRVAELTAQRNEARARAEHWERLYNERVQSLTQQIDPDLEVVDPGAFQQAQLNRTLDERDARNAREQAQLARQGEMKAAADAFFTKVSEVRDSLPDFDQVFGDHVPVSEVGLEYLSESANGPAIAYHLGKNVQEATRIANLPPAKQAAALAAIDRRVSMPERRKTTTAPKPAGRVTGGASGGSFDPSTASIDDVAKQLGY